MELLQELFQPPVRDTKYIGNYTLRSCTMIRSCTPQELRGLAPSTRQSSSLPSGSTPQELRGLVPSTMMYLIPNDVMNIVYKYIHDSNYNRVKSQYYSIYKKLILCEGDMTTISDPYYEAKMRPYTCKVMWRYLVSDKSCGSYQCIYSIFDVYKYPEVSRHPLPNNYRYSRTKRMAL